MELINLVLGISNLLIGSIIIVFSIPLKNRSVKMNIWYGFKISKSYESKDLWHKINEYGANRFIKWSTLIILAGLLSFLIPFNQNIFLILLFSFFPMIIIIPIYETIQYAKQL